MSNLRRQLAAIREAPSRLPKVVQIALGLLSVLIAYNIVNHVLSRGAPLGIVAVGVVFGSLNALVAIGIVLVYRANKVINFAQAEFGSIAAVLAIEFRIQLHFDYFLAVGAGLLMAALIGGLLEVTVIRRFRRAPRLILAVVTIGLAQVLGGFSVLIPLWWTGQSSEKFTTPFHTRFTIAPVVLNGNYAVAVVAVIAVLSALT
ncbi:MAG: hypothetical protein QOG64_3287, partial [Acidimicrobiaceae bacterium]|nr:hypothetical protein [Acidimicrobiaceae bacterium]